MATTTESSVDREGDGESAETQGTASLTRETWQGWLAALRSDVDWPSWSRELAQRKHPESLPKLVPRTAENPLFWSMPGHEERGGARRLLQSLFELRRRPHQGDAPTDWQRAISDWIDQLPHRVINEGFAIECLGWAHALPRLAPRVEADSWWNLASELVERVADVINTPGFPMGSRELLMQQLFGGELALTLALQFPKTELAKAFAVQARRIVSDGMVESLDGEGILKAQLVAEWRQFLACWTRCMYVGKQLSGDTITKDARLQYEWFVRQTLRLRRADGLLIFDEETARHESMDGLLRAALEIGGDRLDRDVFAVTCGRKRQSASAYEFPQAGEHSEWAEVSVLRSDWSQDATYCGVTFHESRYFTELGVGPTRIWWGSSNPEISIDNVPLQVEGEWEELCWESDSDGDYLELELSMSEGWRIQRHLYLPRTDQFLFAADAVIGPCRASIDYQWRLPFVEGITCTPEAETTEVAIAGRKPLGWMMPLALPEWRSALRSDTFDGQTLKMQSSGAALFAPLFIDLDPQRRRKPRTWRQLTVAEQLRIFARDQAVAYRVQIGDEHWVVYRALSPPGNSTFLGHNLTSEFLIGRFNSEGIVESLIEIE